jgi:hypothetical protein
MTQKFSRCTSSHGGGQAPEDHALVLAYVSKHGYMDIADIVAPLTLLLPHVDIVSVLNPVAVMPYVHFCCMFSP